MELRRGPHFSVQVPRPPQRGESTGRTGGGEGNSAAGGRRERSGRLGYEDPRVRSLL